MTQVDSLIVTGQITANELLHAIKQTYPDRNVTLETNVEKNSSSKVGDSNIVISSINDHIRSLEAKLEEREREFCELEETASKAGLSIQALNKQQLALYDEFVLLRQRYDEQKMSLVNILWTHCTKYHPELRQIPTMEDEEQFEESDDKVGHLHVGEALGEGQFATVRSCTRDDSTIEYALKIIKKEKITSFASLQRVSNEIDNLKLLKSPYVVTVSEVMHTATKLYIVTEKGGFDLFEFFDAHQDGVSEQWAREIVVCILKGVLYCHDQGICHRDLKPENILLKFDTEKGKCDDLKLCDFGLSTKFKPKVLLTDFCGSPGFFAPEMIIHGAYYGDKADVWSIGCILLELVMGHEKFCDCWMTAYDYEILQDKEQFTASIEDTADELPSLLTFSDELNDFVQKFLELRSTKRPNVRGLCAHPWLEGLLDAELSAMRGSKLESASPSRSLSPSMSFIMDPADAPNRKENISHNQDAIKIMYNNLSDKERRQMEEYIMHHKQMMAEKGGENGENNGHHHHQMSLPPIVPQTPSLKNVKKIMRKGNELVNANTYANSQQHGGNSHSGHVGFHSLNSNGSSNGGSGKESSSAYDSPAPHSSQNSHSSHNNYFSPQPSPQPPWGSGGNMSPSLGSQRNTLPKVLEASTDMESSSGGPSQFTSPNNERRDNKEGPMTPRGGLSHRTEGSITPRGGRTLLVSFSEKLLNVADDSADEK